MKTLFYLLIAIAGGIGGYFLGAYQGKAAQEALAKVEAAATEAKKAHDATVRDLETRLKELQATYDKEKREINAQYEEQRRAWASELAQRDERIARLTAARSETQAEILRLKDTLANASPEEKARLVKRIAELSAELEGIKTYLAGLECSKVTVPKEYLDILKGEKS